MHFLESCLLQKPDCFGTTHAGAAMRNDLTAGVKFADTFGQIAQRNKIAANVTNLVFVRLTHVQHEKILARVQAAFEFFHLYLGNTRLHWLLLPANPAEFIVVDQLGNRWMLAASGAV